MLEGPPHLRTPGSPTCTLVLKISLAGPGGRQPLWSLATGTLWDSCPQPPGHKGSRSLFPCLIQTLRLETTCSLRRVFLPTQCRKCFLIYCQLVQLGKVLIKFPCLKPLNNQRMWPGRPRVLLGDRARGWGGGAHSRGAWRPAACPTPCPTASFSTRGTVTRWTPRRRTSCPNTSA